MYLVRPVLGVSPASQTTEMGVQPDFSIIVPSYNRPDEVADCVASLARQDYPRDRFEVIVVDDGSVVSPAAVIEPFRGRLDVRIYRQTNAGPSVARNRGAHLARGQLLAFTDDDCKPDTDWLKKLAARFDSTTDPVIIGGEVRNALRDNLYATASQMIVELGYAYHNSDPNKARFFTTSNLAVPANHFRQLGGFNESFGKHASEDRELCGRWQHRGYRMIYAPEVVVHHAHKLTWSTFLQQHFNYGRGAIHLQQARVQQGWQVYSPDSAYYRLLLKGPFSRFPFRHAVVLAHLLLASQSLAMAGMLAEWSRLRWKLVLGERDG